MSNKYEHMPFPDIPVLRQNGDELPKDEEQDVYVEHPHDVYTGAPESALDSVQLQPEYSKEVLDGVSEPLLNLAREYSKSEVGESTYAKTSSTEFGAARETLEFILNNPEHISMSLKYLGELDALFDFDADTSLEDTPDLLPDDITLNSANNAVKYIKDYVGSNYQEFIIRNNSEQYSDDTIHNLFHSIATEGNSLFEQETAEGILRTYLAELESADDCTHVLYEICAEAMNSGDPNKIRFAVDLMAGKTSLMKFGDDLHLKFLSTTFSMSDTALRENHELDVFYTLMTHELYPKQYNQITTEQSRYIGTEENRYLREAARYLVTSDPDRASLINAYVSRKYPTGPNDTAPAEFQDLWPDSMLQQDEGRLSTATKAYSARHNTEYIEKGIRYVQLPGGDPNLYTIESARKSQFISGYIHALRSTEQATQEDNRLNGLQLKTYLEAICLDYYPPEDIRAFKEYERNLKLDIVYGKERLISQRGVFVEVTDPTYKSFAIDAIEFYRDEDAHLAMQGSMRFKLHLGNYFVEGTLDEQGNISVPNLPSETKGVAKFQLTNIVASHAHEILCLKDHELDDLQDDESRRAFEADSKRSMHRRLLPEGDGPTKEQMEIAKQHMWAENIELANLTSLRELLGVSTNDQRNQFELRELAKDRGVDRDIRLYTFVRETPYSEDDLKNLPPIRIKSVQGRISELASAAASDEVVNGIDGNTDTDETEA